MPDSVDLGPASLDVSGVRAGDRNLLALTLTEGNRPVDLSGLELTAQVRVKSTDLDAALTAVVTVTDASKGQADLRFPGDDVRDLLAGKASWKGVWDLQLGNGSGDPVTLVAGKWSAEMDVTRG